MRGLLYFAQNPAFQHLTKIGKTIKLDVEDRGLTGSNVPEDFDYLAVLECEDVDWAEKKVHEQFNGFRHYSTKGRKTEFFWTGCIKAAIKYALDLKGVYDATKDETEEVDVVSESGEKQKQRTPQTTFEMIGLPVGSEIYFRNDQNFTARTIDNKNQVEYNGQTFAISALAIKLYKEQVNKKQRTLNGYLYFYYDNKRLWDLRPDQQIEIQ
ncbi:MAG: GIY-YIG nuclease family protein [Clostridia bacterium]|nr:GIY-YIG nuclease family protein [Clostridia bacterium]